MKVHAHITDTTVRLFDSATLKLVGERLITDLPPGEDITARIKDWADVLEVEVVSTQPWPEQAKIGGEHINATFDVSGNYLFSDGTKACHLYLSHDCGSFSLLVDADALRQIIMRANLALAKIA